MFLSSVNCFGAVKVAFCLLALNYMQAEAIRKILGQDSSRKKREDKIKKRQEELAQVRKRLFS